MKLAVALGLGPGYIVLDEDPAPPKRGTAPLPPIFGPCPLWPNGWMDIPLGMEVGLGPGDFALDEDPTPPQKMGHSPKFSTHVYCGQTAGWIFHLVWR